MLWFIAGLSLGTCLGVVVASLCFAATAGRRAARAGKPKKSHPTLHRNNGPYQTRM